MQPDITTTYGVHRWRLAMLAWIVLFLLPVAVAGAAVTLCADLDTVSRATIFSLGLGLTVAAGWLGSQRLLGTLTTVFDLLSAMREGDYSIRGHLHPGHDPLQRLIADVNDLSDRLRRGRRKRTEASRFLGKTLTVLQNPVFVVDDSDCLLLINPAARRLIGAEGQSLIGRDIASLGLNEALAAADDAILNWHFANASGRWVVRRAIWHIDGREHTLVMLHDVRAVLGEAERGAWQRLLRVLSHELNNSLTPISSLAGSLSSLIENEGLACTEQELRVGLEVIDRRAASLARFLSGYGKLARLPPLLPKPYRLDLSLLRIGRLENRMSIDVARGEPVTIVGDEDQLSQAFINLLRNAVDAALPRSGAVRVSWYVEGPRVRITIEDEGIGLPHSGALFVPFFTTKPEGSGIGLSLTRLIVEAHAGSVDLDSRLDGPGATATVRLPSGL